MKTMEQLKDLAKELNKEYSKGVLKFSVINNKHGTGIRVRGTWGKYGGYSLKTGTCHSFGGLYQGYGRTDEEFVAELKKDVHEVIENLLVSWRKHGPSRNPNKFDEVMMRYILSL